jgi:hypothetical protein
MFGFSVRCFAHGPSFAYFAGCVLCICYRYWQCVGGMLCVVPCFSLRWCFSSSICSCHVHLSFGGPHSSFHCLCLPGYRIIIWMLCALCFVRPLLDRLVGDILHHLVGVLAVFFRYLAGHERARSAARSWFTHTLVYSGGFCLRHLVRARAVCLCNLEFGWLRSRTWHVVCHQEPFHEAACSA